MYRIEKFKKLKKLKGNIAVYVTFLGVLCITIGLIIFKGQLERRENIESIVKSTLEQSAGMKYTEHLFAMFKEQILNNNIQFNTDSIKNYLQTNYDSFKIIFESSKLTYNTEKDAIAVTYPFDRYNNQIDYYSFSVEDGRIRFQIMSFDVLKK